MFETVFTLLTLTVELILCLSADASDITKNMVEEVRGIDVSKWQGDIDWTKVKAAGIEFAIAKASEGGDIQDPKFLQNWKGMRENDIAAAAYHYFRGNISSELQEKNIRNTLERCDFNPTNDVLAIDVEKNRNEDVDPDKMADNLNALLELLKQTYKNIYIYCSPLVWEEVVAWKKYDFGVYNLWIAHWTNKEEPLIPTTWQSKGYIWWQYSSEGTVDGISGPVDLDRAKPIK